MFSINVNSPLTVFSSYFSINFMRLLARIPAVKIESSYFASITYESEGNILSNSRGNMKHAHIKLYLLIQVYLNDQLQPFCMVALTPSCKSDAYVRTEPQNMAHTLQVCYRCVTNRFTLRLLEILLGIFRHIFAGGNDCCGMQQTLKAGWPALERSHFENN